MNRLAVVLLLATACDQREGQDMAVRWADRQLVKDTGAAEKAEDPTYPCASILQAQSELKGNRSARGHVAAGEQACARAVRDFAERRLAAAAKARPPAAECLDADRALALLAAFGRDAGPLDRRRKELCP